MSMQPRIVVVDDDPDMRRMIKEALSGAGFLIEELVDGAQLADRLRTSPRPELVLLDINMPVQSGWGTLNELRADPALASVPFIMVTSYDDEDFRRRADELGAKGYIVKPFTPRELVNRVRVALFG